MATFYPDFIQQQYENDPRITYARLLQQQSANQPVQSPMQGLAKVLQAGLAKYQTDVARKDFDERAGSYNERLAKALQSGTLPELQQNLSGIPGMEPQALGLMSQNFRAQADREAAAREFERQKELEGYKAKLRESQDRYVESERGILDRVTGKFTPHTRGAGGAPTKGQEKVDAEFAKTYNEFVAEGGYADAVKGVNQLRGVLVKLQGKDPESGDFSGRVDITGPGRQFIPDIVRKFSDEESLAARASVEEVVQRNLRLILGAQFTEREGVRLIERAYDENLSESENARRVSRLIKAMEDAIAAKAEASRYYEENGTLAGWRGKLPTMGDIEAAIDGPTSVVPSSGWGIEELP